MVEHSKIPQKPTLEGLEKKWDEVWDAEGIYHFDASRQRDEVFSIDTPPPTVSGSLHMGHMFSYTHTDIVARYQRMTGLAVFYPMGWDDNGLPTERRVQNYYGVRCDPSLPYDAGFVIPLDAGLPSRVKKRQPIQVSRPNFIELCERLVAEDEKVFEDLFRTIGLSVDWTRTYTTIDSYCRRVSQLAFLENLKRGEAYQAEAPSLWDVTLQTAVAQAELDDRETPGAYHKLRFRRNTVESGTVKEGGTVESDVLAGLDEVWVDTTRPELVPACVALVAHPDDERYRPLFGSTVFSPIFSVEVPVLSHGLADPDKGTGIAMICTFGDTTDVTWWRELNLTVRTVIGRDGRFNVEPPDAVTTKQGQTAYSRLAGKTVKQARKEIVAMFTETDDMDGEPRQMTHPVKFFEKGDQPLEIVSSRQWYIRNGGRDTELRQQMIDRGTQMNWVPQYMQTRYDNWINGLNGDWLISRQRFFGVPIPLWYRLDSDSNPIWSDPILPDTSDPENLPVDPSTDTPRGWDETQRDQPDGFTGDPDVMDTWATSSLTPQITTGWCTDEDLYAATFPMDMRPQAHDIIRTWLFSTVVRAHFDGDTVPWHNCVLSGWVLDPDRKKMSKSKGNVTVPTELLERYGADAVRYWAANGRPGTDTAFDEQQLRIGRRLAMKILNASKFVLSFEVDTDEQDELLIGEYDDHTTHITQAAEIDTQTDKATAYISEALDRSMLQQLAGVVQAATEAFTRFDYARALERTESFFWNFTDNYIELVKARAYGELNDTATTTSAATDTRTTTRPAKQSSSTATRSARCSLRMALSVLQRLFAPFMPFVVEEVWRWWHSTSIHTARWPQSDDLRGLAAETGTEPAVVAADVLGAVRRAKSEAKKPLRTPVIRAVVTDSSERLNVLTEVAADVQAAGCIAELVYRAGSDFKVEVELEA